MPQISVSGTTIEYSEAGKGFPLLLCHEFGGSRESWDAQVRFFARRYRVITYNARGFPPSDVPDTLAAYSQDQAVDDAYQLLQQLGIDQAYVGGLSMGGSTALHFALQHPQVARAIIVGAAGTGSNDPDGFRRQCFEFADTIEREGMSAMEGYATGPTRLQLRRKDPVGYDEFCRLLAQHSPLGSALTLRGVQAGRPSIFDLGDDLAKIETPTLILVGDEDDPSLDPALFMKRHIKRSGLVVFPQAGHAINLEDPAFFNQAVMDFLTAVEAGTWATREAGSGVTFR